MKKLCKVRRLIASFLISFCILNFIPTPVKSFNIESALDIKQIVYSNVSKITSVPSTFTDQRGLLKGLKNILISGIWVDYIYNNTEEGLNFSTTEKNLYYSSYSKKLNEFRNKYIESEDSKYIPIKLSAPGGEQKQEEFINLIKDSASYLDIYFNSLLTEYNKKDDNGKEIFLNENKSKILMGYQLMLRFNQEYEFLHGLTSKVDNPNLYSIDISPISKVLSKGDYKIFYDKAIQELEKGINTVEEIKLSEGELPIDKFTFIDPTSGDKQMYVNKAYLASFSASSLYLPLQSKVGDESFAKSLSFLVSGDEEILKTYSELAVYKKPLYVRDYKESVFVLGDPKTSGDANRITIGELIDMVRDGKTGSLITIKGKFQETEDSDTYKMSLGNQINRYENGQESGTYSDDKKKEETNVDDKEKEEKPSNNSGSEIIQYGGKDVPLEETITESNKEVFSDPVLSFGKEGLSAINTMLLINMFSDKNPEVKLSNKSFYDMQLYVNPFGDIVLSDNTIVVPASANASYYTDSKDIIYNPFTDAFMDSYPGIYKQEDFLVPSSDTGKIAIHTQDEADKYNNYLIPFYHKSQATVQGFVISKKDKIKKTGFASNLTFNPIDIGIYDPSTGEKQIIFEAQKKNFDLFKGKVTASSRSILVLDTNTITSDGVTVPLYPVDNAKGEETVVRNNFVVNSYYSTIVTNEDDSKAKIANDRIDVKKLFNIMTECFNGRTSVYGYEKGVYNSATVKEDDGLFSGLVKIIRDIANSIISQFGEAPGMLGLRSAMQDKLMGNFLYYAKLLMPLIVLIIGIVFLILYAKSADNFAFIIAKALFVCLCTYVSIYFIPKYLANITNLPVNNGSNYLGFDSLKLRQEMMIDKSSVTATYSDYGKFGFSNSSITLYAFSEDQLKTVCDEYDADYLMISSGGSFVLDDGSGLFIQGDKLKMNLDRMFNTTSIQTKITNVSNLTFYSLYKTTHVSSVTDYYIPYSVIMDGFISKLNDLSEVYKLTRTTLPYPRGIRKDNFFVNSYVNSPIFLSPDDPKDSDPSMGEDLYDRLVDKFYSSEVGSRDWIGLSDSLRESITSGESRDTLWYQTMEQNGFVGSEELNLKRYNSLVFYVNDNTKKFLVDNKDILSYMSDENLIEITSLYATILFNNSVSEFGNKLYPGRLNYEELSVLDTIRPVITKDYNRYTGLSRDVVTYVEYEYGPFGLVGLSLIVLFQGLTSLFLTYALYIMYLMLLVFLLLKLLTKSDTISNTFSGFIKLYGLLLAVYFINVKGFQILNNFQSSGLTIFFLVIMSSSVLGITTSVVYYVVTGMNSLDFGNNKINGTFSKFLGKLPFLSNLAGKNGSFRDLVTGRITNRNTPYSDLGLDTNDFDVWRDTYDDVRTVKGYINDKYSYHYDYETGYKKHNPQDYGSKKSNTNGIVLEDDSVDLD